MATRLERFENLLHDILQKAGLPTISVGVYSDNPYGDPQGVFAVPDSSQSALTDLPLSWTVYVGRRVKHWEFKYWAIRAFLDIVLWNLRSLDQPEGQNAMLWEDICDRIAQAWTADTSNTE